MKQTEKCLVCGQENIRTYYTEDGVGLVEDYYYCSHCGYFYQMAYSPLTEGVTKAEDLTPDEVEQIYGKRIKELDLSYVDEQTIF